MKSDLRYAPLFTRWCAALEVSLEDVRARGRGSRHVVVARQVMAFLLYQQRPQPSKSEVGRLLGDRDHSTVLVAIRKFERALADREPWAVEAVAACAQPVASSLELESPIETLRRCQAAPLSFHEVELNADAIEIELAEVGT